MCGASSLVWHQETQKLYVIPILSQRQGDKLTNLLHIATLSDPLRRLAGPNVRLSGVPTGLRISISPSRTPLRMNVIVTGMKILHAGNVVEKEARLFVCPLIMLNSVTRLWPFIREPSTSGSACLC